MSKPEENSYDESVVYSEPEGACVLDRNLHEEHEYNRVHEYDCLHAEPKNVHVYTELESPLYIEVDLSKKSSRLDKPSVPPKNQALQAGATNAGVHVYANEVNL